MELLKGKKALVVGIANEHSIAYGCAKAFYQHGCEVAITYQSEKSLPFIQPLLPSLGNPDMLPCDVTVEGSLEKTFSHIRERWGTLDVLVHSIAFATRDDLHGRVVDSSRDGFLRAMDVSCHSFIRMAKLAEPLMQRGGALFTMTYIGAEKVIAEYSVMGPVKAALESSVRYLAAELGEKNIRVHAISPGPIRTRAASGVKKFEELLMHAAESAPLHQQITIDDVGQTVAFLASEKACRLTGETIHIDGGYHIVA